MLLPDSTLRMQHTIFVEILNVIIGRGDSKEHRSVIKSKRKGRKKRRKESARSSTLLLVVASYRAPLLLQSYKMVVDAERKNLL